jgi:hypothetical protein
MIEPAEYLTTSECRLTERRANCSSCARDICRMFVRSPLIEADFSPMSRFASIRADTRYATRGCLTTATATPTIAAANSALIESETRGPASSSPLPAGK